MRSRWKAVLTSSLLLLAATVARGENDGAVRRVSWLGARRLSAKLIAADNPLAAGETFSDSLVAEGLRHADSLYFAHGMLDTGFDVDTLRAGRDIDVTVTVREGAVAALGELTITGTGALAPAAALEIVGVREGDPFDPAFVGEGMGRLLGRYTDEGFPWAQVWLTGFSVDRVRHRVDLDFSVFEGERSTVAAVRFEGIGHTDTSVALRTARLQAGGAFREEDLAAARRRLAGAGLFSEVGEPVVRRRGGGAVEVVIPVTENKRPNAFQGAFGFSQKENGDYRLNGSALLDLRNIAGTGRGARFDWLNDGEDYSRIELAYLEPFLLGSPLRLRVELGQVIQDTIYTWHTGGAYVTWPVAGSWAVTAGAAVDRNVPGEGILDRSLRQRYRLGVERIGERTMLRLHVEGAHKRNHFVSGDEVSEGQFLGRIDLSGPAPIGGGRVVHFRCFAEGVFASGAIEPAERYSLGGATTLRGYRENQFRGERIAFLSAEYRLLGDGRVFVFDDVGAFYTGEAGWTVKNGVGFGIRSDSPLGVIELAFGVGERLSLDDTRIHISLSQSF